MKKISIILSLMFIAGMAMSQVQTISFPGAKATVKQSEIQAWGQTSMQNASRSIIVLDFEGLGDNDPINNFYNGGTSGNGNSGTNYGIQFGIALGLIDSDAGGTGNFANEPSPNTIMYFLDANQAYMNVPAGFTTGFSFFYSANTTTAFVQVWDGLNGTGNMLASANLVLNWNSNGCTGDPSGQYCNWDPIGVTFSGTAKSVVFGGDANYVGFDDVTFGSENPGQTEVPISNWALILGAALIAVFIGIRVFILKRA